MTVSRKVHVMVRIRISISKNLFLIVSFKENEYSACQTQQDVTHCICGSGVSPQKEEKEIPDMTKEQVAYLLQRVSRLNRASCFSLLDFLEELAARQSEQPQSPDKKDPDGKAPH